MGPIRRRSAVLLSATILAGAALSLEPAAMRSIDVSLGDGRLTVGAVHVPLWSAAFAQAPDQVTLDNVTLEFGWATYKAKRIVVDGLAGSRADLEALFDRGAATPFAERFAKITARRIVIPELVTEQAIGGMRSTSTQTNTVLTGVAGGRVAEIAADGGSGTSDAPEGKSTMSFGRMLVSDLDIAGFARIAAAKSAPDNAPLQRLVGSFGLENMQVDAPEGARFTIARVTGRNFAAGPVPGGWDGALQKILDFAKASEAAKTNPGGKLSDADATAFLSLYADLFDAFDYGSMEMTGLTIVPPKKAAGGATARIARIAYSGSSGGQVPDMRMEGFEIAADKGSARIGTIAFTGFSFDSTMDGLRSLKGKSPAALAPEDLRKLVPTIGTVRFSGFDFDLPNDKAGPGAPKRVQFQLKDLEFTADKPQNGVPTNVRIALQNLAMPVPADTKQEGLKEIAALGYKALDLSFTTAAAWQEPGELVIREVSTRMPDAGSVSVKGLLGNVSKDVFNPDSAIALVALVGATARNVEVTVENSGLFDRVLAQQAKQQGKTSEALRREYGTAAAIGIPALLGNSAQARTLAQAIGRFVAKPGRLTIAARTLDSAGLGFADVMSVTEPGEILGKLEITATAE